MPDPDKCAYIFPGGLLCGRLRGESCHVVEAGNHSQPRSQSHPYTPINWKGHYERLVKLLRAALEDHKDQETLNRKWLGVLNQIAFTSGESAPAPSRLELWEKQGVFYEPPREDLPELANIMDEIALVLPTKAESLRQAAHALRGEHRRLQKLWRSSRSGHYEYLANELDRIYKQDAFVVECQQFGAILSETAVALRYEANRYKEGRTC